jgi:hypothetical protein
VWETMSGKDDHDACTVDQCKNDQWVHIPPTDAEVDDGDPCTDDICDPATGIQHIPTCG